LSILAPVPTSPCPATGPVAPAHGHLRVLTALFTIVFIVGAVFYLVGSTGIVDPSGHAVGRDFINLWTAARLVVEGEPATVFDVERFHQVQQSILGQEFPLHLWSYPPHLLFAVAPLGLLPYWLALALWSVATTALYAWAAGWPRPGTMLLLALAPATLVNIACGQTGALAAALFFGGLRLMHARPLAAGVLFGLLTVKPQLGLLVPIVLLMERRWLAIASATATTVALAALSAAVFGPELWEAYFRQNFAMTRSYLEGGTGLFMVMAPSPFMAMRLYGAPIWAAYVAQAVSAVLVLGGVILVWRSRASLDQKVAVTGIAALLASPYAHNYDMTLVSVAVLAGSAMCQATGCTTRVRLLLGLVWLLPVAIMPLHAAGIIIAPWVLLILYGWLVKGTVAADRPEGLG
jgi:hypothetical protein